MSKERIAMLALASLLAGGLAAQPLHAQTLTSGAIAGSVFDPSGAVVESSTITAVRVANGATRTVKTSSSGNYYIPLLDPGSYEVLVEARGFRREEISPVSVGGSQTLTLNIFLKVGKTTESVWVEAPALLLETDNPNNTTILDARTIADLPNPGMDLTYVANFAPGAVMNTTSFGARAGNVEFNGLPSVSNSFTIDGLDANDPTSNLNLVGASNLQLGLNAIQEVSINTTAFSADQGRLGAAQINYLTKSGTNRFHGNLFELWNGSALNAADYFINANQFQPPEARPHKPRSNVNEFGGSIGGPIRRDKLFFFTDVEGLRFVLPFVGDVTLPSNVYQNYVLSQLPKGGCDYELSDCTDLSSAINYPSEAAELPLYQTMFKLYGNVSGVPQTAVGCPLKADGSLLPIPSPALPSASIPSGDGCVNHRVVTGSQPTRETLWTLKIDHNVGPRDTMWYRFQMDNGVQATYTDPINPIFNVRMPVPQTSGSASWVHTFSPLLVNQFTPGFAWSSAIAQPANFVSALQTFPIVLCCGPFTQMGGANDAWPSGQNITQWQLIDNLSWAHGKNQLKFGGNLRRVLISGHGGSSVPTVQLCSFSEFTYGTTCDASQSFSQSSDEPFGLVNLDLYAMDALKLTPKFSLTLGLRAAWNSDPVSQHGHVSRLREPWYNLDHNVNQPLSQDIITRLSQVFPSSPLVAWQPRAALGYQVMSKTVLRAGFGVFSDLLPGSLGGKATGNPPYNNTFDGGLFGASGGLGIAPGVPGSAIDVLAAANQQYLATFSKGTLSCASPQADSSDCVPQIGITAVDNQKYPYSMQWSLGIQRELAANWGLTVQYVGTRSVQSAYVTTPNGFETICDGCYKPWPFRKAPDARFGLVREILTGANGNYNGLQITGEKRMDHGLQFRMNYTWGHCLDTVSNGGLIGFGGRTIGRFPTGDLGRYYGNCDYDIRHSLNGFYTWQLPFHFRERHVNEMVRDWQVSGSVILHTGLPLSVVGPVLQPGAIRNAGFQAFPNLVRGQPLYAQHALAGVTPPGEVQWLNPDAFSSVVDPFTKKCIPAFSDIKAAMAHEANNSLLCQDGNLARNFFRSPGFNWSDLFISRRFRIAEQMSLKVEAQLYNFLNHPNMGNPSYFSGVPGRSATLPGVGAITSTASPPTGLLGGSNPPNLSAILNLNLGGDTSVRMIAFRLRVEF